MSPQRWSPQPHYEWTELYILYTVVFDNVDRDNGMFVSNRDLGDDDGQREGQRDEDPLVFVLYVCVLYMYVYRSVYNVFVCVYVCTFNTCAQTHVHKAYEI